MSVHGCIYLCIFSFESEITHFIHVDKDFAFFAYLGKGASLTPGHLGIWASLKDFEQ